MKAFEIHTFHGGRWKIDSVFDDRELAIFEAKRMDTSTRYAGVRVVEEIFDESNSQTATRTVYRGTRVAQANEEAVKQAADVRTRAHADRRRRTEKKDVERKQMARKARNAKSSPFRLIAIMSLLVFVALGALYGLSHLQDTM